MRLSSNAILRCPLNLSVSRWAECRHGPTDSFSEPTDMSAIFIRKINWNVPFHLLPGLPCRRCFFMTREEKIRVQELRKEGKGYRVISDELGISISTIASFCKKHENDCLDICLQCGKHIEHTPHRKKKRFCSDQCRALWWNAHLDQVNRQAYYKAICQYCGKEFLTYGNDHRKFCSKECYASKRKADREQ